MVVRRRARQGRPSDGDADENVETDDEGDGSQEEQEGGDLKQRKGQ